MERRHNFEVRCRVCECKPREIPLYNSLAEQEDDNITPELYVRYKEDSLNVWNGTFVCPHCSAKLA